MKQPTCENPRRAALAADGVTLRTHNDDEFGYDGEKSGILRQQRIFASGPSGGFRIVAVLLVLFACVFSCHANQGVDVISWAVRELFEFCNGLHPRWIQLVIRINLIFAAAFALCFSTQKATRLRSVPVQVILAGIGALLAGSVPIDKILPMTPGGRTWTLILGALSAFFLASALPNIIVVQKLHQDKLRKVLYGVLAGGILFNFLMD